jgi:colanic acid biosynthesis glycosyl transferase WcaI
MAGRQPMRILMLIQWCHPEPDFKCMPMARALRARGHEVEVLTGFPNYPGGQVYPGYRIRPWQREFIDGIRVTRVALYPSHDRSALRRAANYLSFALSSALLGPWLVRRPDVVYAYNPMGLPALVFRWFREAPFVYDIQDLWPDSLVASGMMRDRPALTRLLGLFFRGIYRQAAHVVVLSEGFKDRLVARGVPAGKVSVVPNWCDESALAGSVAAAKSAPRDVGDKVTILYAGNIGKPQALHVVLAAARLLRDRCPGVRFALIGSGTERADLEAQAAGLANVEFLARVPPSEIGAVMARADALLVHLRDDPLFRITIPSKIQTYLAMGKPILAGVAGDAAALVERAGGGWCFEPENGGALADAAERFFRLTSAQRDELGRRSQAYYRDHLSLGVAAGKFEKIFLSAARGTS